VLITIERNERDKRRKRDWRRRGMEPLELLGTGNFLRSAEMEYVSLIMQEHLAHDCVEKLGELSCVQFTDVSGDGACEPPVGTSRCGCAPLRLEARIL
jgi:hypothetical protein